MPLPQGDPARIARLNPDASLFSLCVALALVLSLLLLLITRFWFKWV